VTTTVHCPTCKQQVEVKSALLVRLGIMPRHMWKGSKCPRSGRGTR
jgi:hypothetical protein